jgi:hypothetical protein
MQLAHLLLEKLEAQHRKLVRHVEKEIGAQLTDAETKMTRVQKVLTQYSYMVQNFLMYSLCQIISSNDASIYHFVMGYL